MMNRRRTRRSPTPVLQILTLCIRSSRRQAVAAPDHKGDYYERRATANRLALVPISAPRGS